MPACSRPRSSRPSPARRREPTSRRAGKFPTFFRVVPNDFVQAPSIVNFAVEDAEGEARRRRRLAGRLLDRAREGRHVPLPAQGREGRPRVRRGDRHGLLVARHERRRRRAGGRLRHADGGGCSDASRSSSASRARRRSCSGRTARTRRARSSRGTATSPRSRRTSARPRRRRRSVEGVQGVLEGQDVRHLRPAELHGDVGADVRDQHGLQGRHRTRAEVDRASEATNVPSILGGQHQVHRQGRRRRARSSTSSRSRTGSTRSRLTSDSRRSGPLTRGPLVVRERVGPPWTGTTSSSSSSTGSTLGSVYALVALGFSMVYGILKLLNFAHGDVLMVGAFIGWGVLGQLGGSARPDRAGRGS